MIELPLGLIVFGIAVELALIVGVFVLYRARKK
jgi:hypothetical protein